MYHHQLTIKKNEIDSKKLTNIDSVTVNREPISDNEISARKYINDSIGESTLLRFNQTLENYLKVSVGNDTYNFTKNNKIQITDSTQNKFPNKGSDFLQKWKNEFNTKIKNSKDENFIKSTKPNSPTRDTGATSLPPIGSSFMYIETSSNNHDHERVFVSFERTDLIQISIITFYYNRFSVSPHDSKNSLIRFKNQLLLEDKTWSTRYNIAKNDRYGNSSTQWTMVNLSFTVENYGFILVYDEIDTPYADLCFSNIIITYSV